MIDPVPSENGRAPSAPVDSRHVDLGPEQAFPDLPARLAIDGAAYYLVRQGADYRLLSTVCPHRGGDVRNAGDHLLCSRHGWRFDPHTGICLDAPREHLTGFRVSRQAGRLVADLGRVARTPRRSAGLPLDVSFSIRLLAHACLEIRHDEFSLLTDPWLAGPAFFGAWIQYPPSTVDVSRLRPNAIWITHEHSDHFHEATMACFDRGTPVFVPNFPSRRLIRRLQALGFQDVRPMDFGASYEVGGEMRLTCFEPSGLWSDSIGLLELPGFRVLNINDAGLNHRIAAHVGPVDLVATSFSPGASGYPQTWRHLTLEQQGAIMDRAREGSLDMVKSAASLYGAPRVLPFASHFGLWHPDQRPFMERMRRNTVDDVVEAFAGSDVQVIDLLPGESWDAQSGQITRTWRDRARLYHRDRMIQNLERAFKPEVFQRFHPLATDLSQGEVEQYFLRLNATPEIASCEDLSVVIRAGAEQPTAPLFELAFQVREGRLSLLHTVDGEPNLTIEIPAGLLERIVRDHISWDEATIGYWCRFSRFPDVYHAGFWRLLQAGYICHDRAEVAARAEPAREVLSSTVIAQVLESLGDPAERIMRHYGLYCAGCAHSTADSVAQGAAQHGLDERQVQRLVGELNRLAPAG